MHEIFWFLVGIVLGSIVSVMKITCVHHLHQFQVAWKFDNFVLGDVDEDDLCLQFLSLSWKKKISLSFSMCSQTILSIFQGTGWGMLGPQCMLKQITGNLINLLFILPPIHGEMQTFCFLVWVMWNIKILILCGYSNFSTFNHYISTWTWNLCNVMNLESM